MTHSFCNNIGLQKLMHFATTLGAGFDGCLQIWITSMQSSNKKLSLAMTRPDYMYIIVILYRIPCAGARLLFMSYHYPFMYHGSFLTFYYMHQTQGHKPNQPLLKRYKAQSNRVNIAWNRVHRIFLKICCRRLDTESCILAMCFLLMASGLVNILNSNCVVICVYL